MKNSQESEFSDGTGPLLHPASQPGYAVGARTGERAGTVRRALARLHDSRIGQLIRFYQAAAVNTAFGFGIYALMIWLGVNLYVAQVIAQVLGVTFNYFTYSRHAFRDREASKPSFVLAYVGNYLVNLLFLWALSQVIRSPYLAGLAATIAASLVNFLVLRSLVFRRKAPLSQGAAGEGLQP